MNGSADLRHCSAGLGGVIVPGRVCALPSESTAELASARHDIYCVISINIIMAITHMQAQMDKTLRAFTLREKLDHVKACQASYGGSTTAYLAALETDAACGRFNGPIPVSRNLRTWLTKRDELEHHLASKGMRPLYSSINIMCLSI